MSSKNYSFAWYVAVRYFFSKKTHNAINIISGISAAGVAVVTAALICVLSVFNGFGSLVGNLYSAFDPDLKIAPVSGKYFNIENDTIKKVLKLPEIQSFTQVVEDNALLRYGEKQMPAVVKGVSDGFEKMTRIDSIMYDGYFQLFDGGFYRSVVGLGVAATLGVNPHFFTPLRVYAPKCNERVNMLRPDKSLNEAQTYVSGIFNVKQAQYDDNYVIISLAKARELFEVDSASVSAVELKLIPNINENKIKNQIINILGKNYTVKNKIEQQESFFHILQIEKWVTFLILCFIVLIASFNIIGSLSMLIIEKKDDISTLRNLGADSSNISLIFLFEGWLISIIGALCGIAVGVLLCLVQQFFGVIKMGDNYVVDSYPVILEAADVALVFLAVVVLGFLAAYYPAKYAAKTNQGTGS